MRLYLKGKVGVSQCETIVGLCNGRRARCHGGEKLMLHLRWSLLDWIS